MLRNYSTLSKIVITLFFFIFIVSSGCINNPYGTINSSSTANIVTCPSVPDASVIILNYGFSPQTVSITVNQIIKWTNNDSVTHTVTSGSSGAPDYQFDSGSINPSQNVCMKFIKSGSYAYYCKIHTYMTGTVTVN